MGRVSSRYNYRLSKTKKTNKKGFKKKLLPADKIVIRNKKKPSPSIKVNNTVKKARVSPKKISPIIKRAKNKKVVGSVTLDNLKDYCRGKKVILVGNARDIIKKEYGGQIDSYDIVVRMNHGHPLPKYVKNMGKKYNIWSHGFLSYKKQMSEYSKIKKTIDYHIETNEQKLCLKIFDNKAFLIPKKWYKIGYEDRFRGKEMSTGLNTATFFINWVSTMSEISIVGFDFLKTTNRVLHSAPARKFHDTNVERDQMVSMLLKSGKYLPFNDKYDFAK